VKSLFIIDRYVFREFLAPFFVTLLVLSAIFLMTRMLDLTDLVVTHRVGLLAVLRMLLYSLPFFLIFVIPMAVMMGVLLGFLRLSGDNEIMALQAGGWSLHRLLRPVLAFCLLGALCTAFMSFRGLPWGRCAFKVLLVEVARSYMNIALKERTFNDTFKDVTLYVSRIDRETGVLHHIFIADRQMQGTVSTITAARGELVADPDKDLWELRLHEGIINQVNRREKTVYSVRFETYAFRLNLAKMLASVTQGPKHQEEMTFRELQRFLEAATVKDDKYYLALLEYHKKFSLPFSCFVLGVLAVPLGMASRTAKRSFGVGLGLVFFLIYYLFLSAGWVFGEAGLYPPVIGMWVPNVVIGAVACFLFGRAATGRSVQAPYPLAAILGRVHRRAKHR